MNRNLLVGAALLLLPLIRPPCQESSKPPTMQEVVSVIESGSTYGGDEVKAILTDVLTIAEEEIQRAADEAAKAVADRCNTDKAVLVSGLLMAEKQAADAHAERDFWRGCTVGVGVSAVLIAILAACGWLIPR
jgi:hypothetical protein